MLLILFDLGLHTDIIAWRSPSSPTYLDITHLLLHLDQHLALRLALLLPLPRDANDNNTMTKLLTYLYLLLLTTSTLAQLSTFTPPNQHETSYSVHIPRDTASSGTGPIYLQLKTTANVNWLAWGEGTRMKGANMFVVYPATDGKNITVSPRLGHVEHVEPKYNSDAKFKVLSGSGVRADGGMTANLRCESCINWPGGKLDLSSAKSPWVWAIRHGSGGGFSSNDVSADITIHDASGVASVNLKTATGKTDSNPFSSPSGSSSSSSNGDAASLSNQSTNSSTPKKRIAHAVLMILVFIIFLPSSALLLLLLPSSKTVDIHALLQLTFLAIAIAGMGLGISLALDLGKIAEYHPIIGLVVVPALILFQPAMGYLQHRHFVRSGGKSVFGYAHRWLGRTLIALGIINAGLGFMLAGVDSSIAPRGAVIAVGVVAGVVGLVYMVTVIVLPMRKKVRPLP